MKVLYITANPKDVNHSHSLSVGEKFIEEYQKLNTDHTVKRIDLYQQEVPTIDYDVMGAWGKLSQGVSFEDLSEVEQSKLSQMNKNLDEFMDADKYVFVAPLWNFGLPPVLKAYIDNVLIAGKTFKYTETGPIGLLENKKSLYIQASGGVYSNKNMQAYEHGSNFMKVPLGFIGIEDQSELLVEGVSMATDQGMSIRQENMSKATALAQVF